MAHDVTFITIVFYEVSSSMDRLDRQSARKCVATLASRQTPYASRSTRSVVVGEFRL